MKKVCVLLFLLLGYTSSLYAMWGMSTPEAQSLSSDLVVLGELKNIRYDYVECWGMRFLARYGTLHIDEVLLAKDPDSVPEKVTVFWGNMPTLGCPRISITHGRYGKGVWNLSRSETPDAFCVTGNEDWVYIPSETSANYQQKLLKRNPTSFRLVKKGDRHFIKIRHMNFSDVPFEREEWQFSNGVFAVPSEITLKLEEWKDENKIGKVISKPFGPGKVGVIKIKPRSFHEQIIDITSITAGWTEFQKYGIRVELKGVLIDSLRFNHYDYEEIDEVAKDSGMDMIWLLYRQGTHVWWYPSTTVVRWLTACLLPVLILASILAYRKERFKTYYSCLGLILGVFWTWLVIDFGPHAILGILMRNWSKEGGRYSLAITLTLILLGLPVLFGIMMKRQTRLTPRPQGRWLLWTVWFSYAGLIIFLFLLPDFQTAWL